MLETAELAALQRSGTSALPRSPGIVSQDHWAVLAVTRFALALIIVNVHYRLILPAPHVHPASQLAIALGGTAAVYGFLLISGFSIAHSIQHGEDGFYRRRFARIWPVLFVGVALYAAAIVVASGHFDPAVLLPGVRTLFFLNGFVAPLWLSPTWSLSIEVLFYIAAPLLNRSVAAVAGLMIVSACVQFFNSELGIGPYAFAMYGIGAAGVFWAWGAGFLAYRYLDSPMFALPVVLIGPMMIGAYGSGDGPYAALTWAIASFALFFGRVINVPPVAQRVATYLGDLSYPLFLTHFGVQFLAHGVGITSWFAVFPLCILGAIVTLHTVDRPLRRRVGASSLFGANPERFAGYILALVIAACAVTAVLAHR